MISGNLFEGTPGTANVGGLQNLVLGSDNLGLALESHGSAVIAAGTTQILLHWNLPLSELASITIPAN